MKVTGMDTCISDHYLAGMEGENAQEGNEKHRPRNEENMRMRLLEGCDPVGDDRTKEERVRRRDK